MEEKYSIGIIVDRTGSVITEKKMLEASINIIIEALYNNYPLSLEKKIIITYLGEEDLLLQVQNNKDFNLNITKLKRDLKKESIFELFEKIAIEKGNKKIFLFSDGYLIEENNWEKFIISLKSKKEFNEIEKIAIGIGEGFNETILKKFSSIEKVFQYRDVYNLV